MEAEDRRIISVFGEFMDMCLEARQQGGGEGPSLRETLVAHFDGPLTEIPVERLEVAAAEFVNLDVALEALVESAGGGSLVGVGGGDQRHHLTFSDMVQGWSSAAPIAPVDRVRVETGPDSSRDAVSFGIHLFRLRRARGDPATTQRPPLRGTVRSRGHDRPVRRRAEGLGPGDQVDRGQHDL